MDIADKITGSTYTAAEFTSFKNETQNTIEGSGITLSSGSSTQLATAVTIAGQSAHSYQDGGIANAYTLTRTGVLVQPSAYFEGMRITFSTSNVNTAASTVNVSGLGIKSVVLPDGNDLTGGEIIAGEIIEIIYDSGLGKFVMAPWNRGIAARNIDSIAELRTISGDFEGQRAPISGYTTAGDGGGGPDRYWSEGQPAATYVDNNISIIVPTGGDGSAAWLMPPQPTYNPRWAGAVIDETITDDSTIIQSVLDLFDDVEIDGIARTTVPLKLNSNNTLNFKSNSGINNDGSTALFNIGNIGSAELNILTYYTCDNVSAGSNTITTSTASNANNFTEGDFVFVRGGSYFTSAGNDFYEYGGINKVISANGTTGDIVLEFGQTEDFTGVTIGLIDTTLISPTDSDNLRAISDVKITGKPKLTADDGNIFAEGGGCLRGFFDFGYVECRNAAFANAMLQNTINCNYVKFDSQVYEFANLSSQNEINIDYAEITTTPATNKRIIRGSENSNNNTINIRNLNLDAFSTAADTPIYLSECRDNFVNIDLLQAENAQLYIAQFASQATTPSVMPLYRNKVRVGIARCGTLSKFVNWADTASTSQENVIIDSRFYGTPSTGRACDIDGEKPIVKNSWFENGNLYRQSTTTNENIFGNYFADGFAIPADSINSGVYSNNTSTGILEAITHNVRLGFVDVISTSSANAVDTQTFAIDSLTDETVLRVYLSGEITGTNGTKHVELYVDTVNVLNLSFLAGDEGDFFASGEIYFSSVTAIQSGFISGGPIEGAQALGGTVPDITANTIDVELRMYQSSGTDTFRLRGYSLNVDIPGA